MSIYGNKDYFKHLLVLQARAQRDTVNQRESRPPQEAPSRGKGDLGSRVFVGPHLAERLQTRQSLAHIYCRLAHVRCSVERAFKWRRSRVTIALQWCESALEWRESALEWRESAALEWCESALKWCESALKWRESALKWRESALKWRESALEWRESALEWSESALEWCESAFKWRESALEWRCLRDGGRKA